MRNTFDNNTDERLIAKGHEDAAAWLHGIAEGVGNGVRKRVAQRDWERHVAKRETHLGV
jgi:hypothetical protein